MAGNHVDSLQTGLITSGGDIYADSLQTSIITSGGKIYVEAIQTSIICDFVDETVGAGSPRIAHAGMEVFTTQVVGGGDPRVAHVGMEVFSVGAIDVRTAHVGMEVFTVPASTFEQLILNPAIGKAYLIDLLPVDVDTRAEMRTNFSQFVRSPVYDGALWRARVDDALTFEEQIVLSTLTVAGSDNRSIGTINIYLEDYDSRDFVNQAWPGRVVRVLVGPQDSIDYSDFEPIFVGVIDDIEWERNTNAPDEIQIYARYPDLGIDTPVTSQAFLGTGGFEGPAEIKGKLKPVAIGYCHNVEPVLVDPIRNLYQVNDGQVGSIIAYHGAGPLSYAGDFSGGSDLLHWNTSPSTGRYATDLSRGVFRIDYNPDSSFWQANLPVTADVVGDKGTTLNPNPTKAGAIAWNLFTRTGILSDANLDLFTFQDLDEKVLYDLGLYVQDGSNTIRESLTAVLESASAYWTSNRLGLLQVGTILPPEDQDVVGIITDRNIERIRRIKGTPPYLSVSVGFQKNWNVMSSEQIAADEDVQANKFLFTESFASNAKLYSYANKLTWPTATEVFYESLISNINAGKAGIQALNEAFRRKLLFMKKRDRYQLDLKEKSFVYRAGQYIRVQSSAFDLSNGKNFVILGTSENTSTQNTSLVIWG